MLRINGNPPRSTRQPSQPHYYNSNNNNVALASCWFLLNGGQFYWIRYYNKTMFAINSWELWLPERRSQTSRPVTDNWYCLISHMRIPNSFSPSLQSQPLLPSIFTIGLLQSNRDCVDPTNRTTCSPTLYAVDQADKQTSGRFPNTAHAHIFKTLQISFNLTLPSPPLLNHSLLPYSR